MSTIEFNNQVLNFKSALSYFALSLTCNSEDAKDLLQDTLVKAIVYKDKFADTTNLKAWLFTIMKNTFINTYRRSVRTKQIMQTNSDVAMARAWKNNYQDITESRLAAKDIIKKIENLEDQYKIPFARYYCGYKYEEIATEMNLPLGTIKSRIFLARKILMSSISRS